MNKLHLFYRNWRILGSCLLLIFLLWNTRIFSQSFSTTSYTIENGLNTNFIHDVTQDKLGRMWFATESGVSVFDGYSWKNYEEKDGLPRAEYHKIKVDSSNNIIAVPYWCSAQIAIFDNYKWSLVDNLPAKFSKIGNFTSFDFIYKNKKLILFFGTGKGVLVYENNMWNLISEKDGLLSNQVWAIRCNQNKIYVATEKGLSIIQDGKVDNNLNSIIKSPSKKIKALDLEFNGNKPNPTIWLLGKEWIGTIQNGKFILQTPNNRMSNISPGQRIRHTVITYDKKDRIYYGSELERFYLERSTKKITKIGQKNGFTTAGSSAIFLDRELNLWFTSFRGIDKISRMSFQNYFHVNGLLENEVTAILEVRPGYFVFGHNRGLTILKDGNFNTIRFNKLSKDYYFESRILDLCKDSLGNVWIAGSELGLGKLNDQNEIKWINVHETVRVNSVLTYKSRTVLAATDQGLYRVSEDQAQLILVENKAFNNFIRNIYCDSKGDIYGAKTSGLAMLSKGVAKEISFKKSYMGNSLFAVQDYTDNKKFLGTADGLYLLEEGTIRKFHENNFSIDKKVFFINRGSGNIFWFGTNDGVVKWDGTTARRYSMEDGLSGRETNRAAFTIDSQGKVWIGTDGGLSCYNPQYDAPVLPPRVISVEIAGPDGIFSRLDKPFNAGHNYKSYTFHIKANTFINEKFIQYRTKLSGFDKDWIENGYNNYIRYTHLPSGDYKLFVQVKNLGSDWSKPFASAVITFAKPFYYQWWFLFFSFSVIVFIYFIVHTNFSQKKYNIKLESEIKERTKALYDSENKLKTVIQNAPITITAVNSAGEILFINQDLPEFPNANNIKKNILDIIPEEKIDYLKNILVDVFQYKKTVNYEIKYLDKKGKERWIESNISPVIAETNVSEAIIISNDVTERKLGETARKEIEERQDAILKALPLVLYNCSVNSNVAATWITDNVYSCTGYDSHKFLYEKYFWSSRIHPDDKEFVLKKFENLAVGKSLTVEYRWLCADGSYKWFLEYAVPKKTDDSSCIDYIGIWLDITEKKQIQQRLEKLNECFLNFGVDPRSNIQRLVTLCAMEMNTSSAFYNFLKDDLLVGIASWNLQDGMAPSALEESICNEVFINNNKELIIINDVDKTPYSNTDRSVTKLGIKTYLGSPVIFNDKTTGSLSLIYQSQKQFSENDLKFVSIISSAIAIEEERRTSQEINQKSLFEKEILLKEIHHRVKNNLQVISSLLFLQSEASNDGNAKEVLKESTARVRSIAMVHEKLYQSLDLAQIDFSEYVESLVNHLFGAYNTQQKISQQIEIEDIFLPIDIAIPSGLIINELVTNSIKYAWPEDLDVKPKIYVSVKKLDGQIFIVVADNGIGLPEEINFETDQKSLGLKLVKMLTNQLSGNISIDRKQGTKILIECNEII